MNMKIKSNPFLYIGALLFGLMAALIILGYFWTPYDPTAMAAKKFLAPSAEHILGTDNFGRDIFSRVIDGAGTTFFIALSVVAIGCVAGIIIGSLCGYYGGLPDLILTRVCDSITAFPAFLLALVVVSVAGSGTYNIILALGVLFTPSFARIVRGEFARCRELNYIKSARLMGAGDFSIMFRHILPNVFSLLLVSMTLDFATCMLTESTLSYLGFGIPLPTPTWGNLLNGANNSVVIQQYWWRWVFPAVIFGACTICINLIGDGLRDAIDPKSVER